MSTIASDGLANRFRSSSTRGTRTEPTGGRQPQVDFTAGIEEKIWENVLFGHLSFNFRRYYWIPRELLILKFNCHKILVVDVSICIR